MYCHKVLHDQLSGSFLLSAAEEEDEIDPLDAFMLGNNAAGAAQQQTTDVKSEVDVKPPGGPPSRTPLAGGPAVNGKVKKAPVKRGKRSMYDTSSSSEDEEEEEESDEEDDEVCHHWNIRTSVTFTKSGRSLLKDVRHENGMQRNTLLETPCDTSAQIKEWLPAACIPVDMFWTRLQHSTAVLKFCFSASPIPAGPKTLQSNPPQGLYQSTCLCKTKSLPYSLSCSIKQTGVDGGRRRGPAR